MPTNSKEYYKEWYEKNRKKLLIQIAEPIECECGRIVVKGNISKHIKSKVHQKIMSKKETESKVKDYDLLVKKYNKLVKKVSKN
jgi:hypothetical protein